MSEQAESDDLTAQRIRHGAERVAAASDEELAEEAHANGFGVSVYRAVVARLAQVSTPPGVELTKHEPGRGRREAKRRLSEPEEGQ